MIWGTLASYGQVPEIGRPLFSAPRALQTKLWREFGNYVRQAKAYWEAADGTRGSSSALLYYYALHNLAKAELLISHPADVFQKKLHHGLVWNPGLGRGIGGDRVSVVGGAFPMLYEARTGRTLPKNSRLEVRRLLLQVPEIGLEVSAAGFGSSKATGVYHSMVGDADRAWVLVAAGYPGALADVRHVTSRTWARYFEPIDSELMPDWRRVFGLSARTAFSKLWLWQSKQTFSIPGAGGPDFGAAAEHLRSVMRPYVADAVDQPFDALIAPSLLASRDVPMPPGLARYALMFYASSLVRYRPSSLDPIREAASAWVFETFTKLAPLALLSDAVAGIDRKPQVYERLGFKL